MLQEIAPKLSEPDRGRALDLIASVKSRIETAVTQTNLSTIITTPAEWPAPLRTPIESQRYLGDVSDVKFFNLVKRVLQKDGSVRPDDGMDSYEQDDLVSSNLSPRTISTDLPSHDSAEAYLDIYFSTIHIAYPFIHKKAFMRTYNRLHDPGAMEEIDSTWLATLCKSKKLVSLCNSDLSDVIFAIGAYYLSFPGRESNSLHQQFFQRALALSNSECLERSVNQVSFLLAKCFYLLAVCRTDRFEYIVPHSNDCPLTLP